MRILFGSTPRRLAISLVSSPIKIYEQYFNGAGKAVFGLLLQGIEKTGTTLAYDLLLINTFIHPQVLVNDAAYPVSAVIPKYWNNC
ncbi:hypothetical protein ACRQ5D_16045 [Mucilaginibacter sp. P25]|uniref:Uncharacterized protein n=1 Tax=Mucilaginibacter gossypii TaxID=551996 RepID=A0A1G8GG67_9SPHI|nr:hypothetical protein [Mucilaginibacter gossypii]SDH93374.1 hypothetical protein SAMN05192573_11449 [Mucilaginibacter gossypii]